MFSIIGIVMLMGLVTKNAILLVDFAIRMRAPYQRGPRNGTAQRCCWRPKCGCAPS
jgi:multidrug efflux pump subunit AcrB